MLATGQKEQNVENVLTQLKQDRKSPHQETTPLLPSWGGWSW